MDSKSNICIENKASLEAAIRSDLNIFVGSAFSIFSRDRKGNPLPTGAELVAELCKEFNKPHLSNQELARVSQIVKSSDRVGFNEFLVDRLTVKSHDERYKALISFSVSRIFTTNIDDLFPRIYQESSEKYLNDIVIQGASFREKAAVEYLPLHGSVNYPDPDFAFTPIEVASAFEKNPTQFQYLVRSVSKSPTFFIGYSLEDAGTLQALSHTISSKTQDKGRWIQLKEADEGTIEYFRSLGFNIVVATTDQLLDYFFDLSKQIESEHNLSRNNTLSVRDFPSGRIPTIQEESVRPIIDFYKGHAPTWYDVLTKRLPITTKYRALINLIDGGRNVMLKGIPVSGKSTLLMQAAAYHDTPKIRLFEDIITPEKANYFVEKIKGKGKVIIFIDNVGESVDALNVLTSCADIQIVCCDRTENINFGSHRFDIDRFVELDCSDLQHEDFSKIFDSIPPQIRKDRMTIPKVMSQYNPSTFEFVEANVKDKSISERYDEVLLSLHQKDRDIHDLFVMISYLFTCHTTASFDVVSRFIGAGGDYNKVYSSVGTLGKLLSEVGENDPQFFDLNEDQDYFSPRSYIISETVVERCRDEDFSRIYKSFHNNVSRLFIPRFSIFRRYGYRSKFATRVFSRWEDGETFYLSAYEQDPSYFLKQQLAIFLGLRRQYGLAFKYIDEALSESGNKNPNIRHTHARLLFDANIDKAAEDPTLIHYIRQSMLILEGCYQYDKRQANHATRFAEQSYRFATLFPGPDADDYLKKSLVWLREELKKTPSLRSARSLEKRIASRIGA